MTLALAIWGAVVSTVALLWNIVRDVRTKPQLARSKHIFEPLHAQLSAARIQILACQRANAINLDFWRHLNESGRIKKIPSRLHRPFRDFYSDTFPNYEVAWNTVNAQAVQDLLEPY